MFVAIVPVRVHRIVCVTGGSNQPLLFLDVDGTLLPYRATASSVSKVDWSTWQQPSNPILSRLTRSLGDRLLALGCDLMWATGWGEDANRVLAPILGLPQLPVVTLPEYPNGDYYADECARYPDDVTAHSFRGAVATILDDAGLSARVTADVLGHVDPAMTQRHYMARGRVHTAAAEALDRAVAVVTDRDTSNESVGRSADAKWDRKAKTPA